MLTLELPSYVLKISNDDYATLILIWLAFQLYQEYSKLIGWYRKTLRRQILKWTSN